MSSDASVNPIINPLHMLFYVTFYWFSAFLVLLNVFSPISDLIYGPVFGDPPGAWKENTLSRLLAIPIMSVSTMAFPLRNDIKFMKLSICGRLGYGGLGIPFISFFLVPFPRSIFIVWIVDLIPALLLAKELREKGYGEFWQLNRVTSKVKL